MLDNIPEDLHRKALDDFGSPKSRQNWAQVNREARRLTQQWDTEFYEKWLRDDFGRDTPIGTDLRVQEVYRESIAVSQQEKTRLMQLAQADDVHRFTAGITDGDVRKRLSNRYGKRPLADAGLAMTRRLAQPRGRNESPPRLRENELSALKQATLVLHALADKDGVEASFCDDLDQAAQQAEQYTTQVIAPMTEVPPAPKRRRMQHP